MNTETALPRRVIAGALVLEGLLAFAPLFLLGPAIGWPESLGAPASQQLNAIYENADAVRFGYVVYLIYSVLILPVMAGAAVAMLGSKNVLSGFSFPTAIAFFAASALARCIGILRWLTAMPVLAAAYATADADTQKMIEVVFTALTEYGGGIGELLGVSIFMASGVTLLCIGSMQHQTAPRWITWSGLACALLLVALLLPATAGVDVVPIAVAATAISVWQIALGAWVFFAKRRVSATH